jgi:hypothetical protein
MYFFRAVFNPGKLVFPEALVGFDPVVHGPELLAVDGVHTAFALPRDAHEADLAEHAQVLGHLGLRPAQFFDQPRDIALDIAAGQRTEDFAALVLGNGGECVGGGWGPWHVGRIIFLYRNMSSCVTEEDRVFRGGDAANLQD